MPLYFVQHGIALDKAENPIRPLSKEGEISVNNIANQLADQGVQINQIFHSGKERAEQTARLFSSAFNGSDIHLQQHMNPNDDINLIIPMLKNNGLYVGHLPHLDKLVSKLLSGDEESRIVQFENAAVVCIIQEGNEYRLNWMIKPTMK